MKNKTSRILMVFVIVALMTSSMIAAQVSLGATNQHQYGLPNIEKGDVNLDGNVDMKDVRVLVNYIFGKEKRSLSFEIADFNEDGRINMSDVVALIKIINEKPTDIIRGDVNSDGIMNMKDVKLLVDYIFGKNGKTLSLEAADFNGDGMINISDVVAMIKYIRSQVDPTLSKPFRARIM